MTKGIERAPVYPDMPQEPLTEAQVESLIAFQNVDELRELIEDIFAIGEEGQYRLTQADLTAQHEQMLFNKAVGHTRSRDTREIAGMLGVTTRQMEDEFRARSLLDIGSGFGRFGEAMARNAKAKVTFLDREPESLARISRRAGQIVLGEGTALPFEDETFDRVNSTFSSVHWAENPLEAVKALNETIRVTKIGGTALIVPLFSSISLRRKLLPLVFGSVRERGEVLSDNYAVVWALRDYALIKSLFNLTERRLVSITWSNHVEKTPVKNITQEIYSGVIDKNETIPQSVYEQNEEFAHQLMPVEP